MPICELIREVDRITIVLGQQPAVDEFSVSNRNLQTSRPKISTLLLSFDRAQKAPALTSLPGQPIHVNFIVFLQPDSAETRPPDDIYGASVSASPTGKSKPWLQCVAGL